MVPLQLADRVVPEPGWGADASVRVRDQLRVVRALRVRQGPSGCVLGSGQAAPGPLDRPNEAPGLREPAIVFGGLQNGKGTFHKIQSASARPVRAGRAAEALPLDLDWEC